MNIGGDAIYWSLRLSRRMPFSRAPYLLRDSWYDFWTGGRADGERETVRPVDLRVPPLYIRAGIINPMGSVKHYTSERVGGSKLLLSMPRNLAAQAIGGGGPRIRFDGAPPAVHL